MRDRSAPARRQYRAVRAAEILGHEVGGVVRAVGVGVTHVHAGDAVALDTSVPCNTCFYCREGRPFMCPNRVSVAAGFSEYNVVPASVVYKLPAGLAPEMGALAEPLSCAIHAVERGEIRPADTVAIVGGGALGLLVLCVARLLGATQLIVSDPDAADVRWPCAWGQRGPSIHWPKTCSR